ncbi:DUF3048 domain-containing protein [Salisediminibacterium halotolerans]|uniref:DUF3048 domain-containing protein n=1 Tax=Salisediminibacterium halotolerans TaxID=517425 RepID=UPI000F2B5D83|nr:DUF3048 domain-containing protein [Salisediminibacterium halotolerans]RLJ71773.1 Protein of unknown function (DUF3048) [Actinophytocola xinjiangensis]RPE86923.1 DUF3048 family protein [Salisediminibacterium halotolerans]TWG32986.1 Protein of unknown function (DUF3048) [Salisediminibacterium halotolerans]GEL08543.1 putative lipoprotein YerB [Salisediminibacterium halotolerans]
MRKTRSFILLLLLLAGACSSADNSASGNGNAGASVNSEADQPDDKDETEENDPVSSNDSNEDKENMYPLSGKKTDNSVDHRAFGLMIEDSALSRPQQGLNDADIVYEALTEGRITRLLAVYHSQEAERIGNVRSARSYFVKAAEQLNAGFVSAGGSPDARTRLESGNDFVDALQYTDYFDRIDSRPAPHDVYTSVGGVFSAAEEAGVATDGPKPPELPFTDELSNAQGEQAEHVHIDLNSADNNVEWEFDERYGYMRTVGGEAMKDKQSGSPQSARNVLLVETGHDVVDDQGRRDIDIESGGKGLLLQEGLVREVSWRNEDGLILPYKDETELSLLPGQTWVHFIEKAGGGLNDRVDF